MTITASIISFIAGLLLASLYWRRSQHKPDINAALAAAESSKQDKSNTIKLLLDIIISSARDAQSKLMRMLTELFDHSTQIAQSSAASLTDIATNVEHSQSNLHEITGKMCDLEQQTSSGTAVSKQLSDVLEEFQGSFRQLGQIQEQMSTILDKAKAISSIGQDAEMLALNAAIEAARAGEMGRGFAVVADSMKSLAKSSQTMSHEIQEVLNVSSKDINDITDAIHEGSEALLEQSRLLVDTYTGVSNSVSDMNRNMSTLDSDFLQTLEIVKQETEKTRTSMEGMIREFTIKANEASGLKIVDLSPQEAKKRLNQFDFLIDVRRADEYNDELGHIDGTRLLTLQTDFPQTIKTLPKDKSYLFICRSGGRSTKAAQQALLHHIHDVYNLDGGMLAWRKAGL